MSDKDERCLDHERRITVLETIITNHIPHTEAALKEVRAWIRGIGIAAILTLLTFVIEHFVG